MEKDDSIMEDMETRSGYHALQAFRFKIYPVTKLSLSQC